MNQDFIKTLYDTATSSIKQAFEDVMKNKMVMEKMMKDAKAGATKIFVTAITKHCMKGMQVYINTLSFEYGKFMVEPQEDDNEYYSVYLILDTDRWSSELNGPSATLEVLQEELAKWPKDDEVKGKKSATLEVLQEELASWPSEVDEHPATLKVLRDALTNWPDEIKVDQSPSMVNNKRSGFLSSLEEEVIKRNIMRNVKPMA